MKQNDCIIIGLTGGIGTGKSTVTNILLQLGYKVIDADGIARMVVEIGKPAYNDIVEIFGLRILLEDKNLNRKNFLLGPKDFAPWLGMKADLCYN